MKRGAQPKPTGAKIARGLEHGLTLVELMVTIGIIGILAATIGVGMTRTDNEGAVDLFAQRLLIAARQARNTAVQSNAVVRIQVKTREFSIDRAPTAGFATPTTDWINLAQFKGSGDAEVVSVTFSRGLTSVGTPAVTSFPATILFKPDGSATQATIYLRDGTTDSTNFYRERVLVFALTGYSHRIPGW